MGEQKGNEGREGRRTGAGYDDDSDPFLGGHVVEGGLEVGGEAVADGGGEVGEVVHGGQVILVGVWGCGIDNR